jgi:ribosomal protein S18 acetylase RimI-like enzyme
VRAALEAEPVVRSAAPDDESFVGRLGGDAFRDFDPRAREHTLELLRAPRTATFVACAGAERLGFVVVERARDGVVLVSAIAVEPRARGRGIGRQLMAFAERAARSWRAPGLRLCTAQANVEALELFLKHGFRIERRMPSFYAKGQDACTLVKALGASGRRSR